MIDLTYSVLVVCRETLLREAVTDAIDCRSGAVLATAAILSSDLREELNFEPDIVIYVDTGSDGEDIERDAANAQVFQESHWILMSDRHNSPLLARLTTLKARLSVTGLNLSRHALAHLVGLSAHGHEVRLDDRDDVILSEERNDILNAGLVASQWRLLRYLGSGMSNKEIAREERTSVNAVKVRVRALLNRLDVANRTQAAVKVAKAGLCGGGEANRTNVVAYRDVETKKIADAVG